MMTSHRWPDEVIIKTKTSKEAELNLKFDLSGWCCIKYSDQILFSVSISIVYTVYLNIRNFLYAGLRLFLGVRRDDVLLREVVGQRKNFQRNHACSNILGQWYSLVRDIFLHGADWRFRGFALFHHGHAVKDVCVAGHAAVQSSELQARKDVLQRGRRG